MHVCFDWLVFVRAVKIVTSSFFKRSRAQTLIQIFISGGLITCFYRYGELCRVLWGLCVRVYIFACVHVCGCGCGSWQQGGFYVRKYEGFKVKTQTLKENKGSKDVHVCVFVCEQQMLNGITHTHTHTHSI